jgi:hypothetical protein
MIFPIMTLYEGEIKYIRPKTDGLFPKSSNEMSTSKNGHIKKTFDVSLPDPMGRRLKARAKKEDIPLELLVQRYLEESMGRHRLQEKVKI